MGVRMWDECYDCKKIISSYSNGKTTYHQHDYNCPKMIIERIIKNRMEKMFG